MTATTKPIGYIPRYNDPCYYAGFKNSNEIITDEKVLHTITDDDRCNLHIIFSGRDLFPSLSRLKHISQYLSNDLRTIMNTIRKLKGRVVFDKSSNTIQIHLGNDVDTIGFLNQSKDIL